MYTTCVPGGAGAGGPGAYTMCVPGGAGGYMTGLEGRGAYTGLEGDGVYTIFNGGGAGGAGVYMMDGAGT